MKDLLEKIWYSYQMQNPTEMNVEKKKILDVLVLNEERLRNELNEEQTVLLENYERCMGEINCISEKDAFVKGLCFATEFFLEALRK